MLNKDTFLWYNLSPKNIQVIQLQKFRKFNLNSLNLQLQNALLKDEKYENLKKRWEMLDKFKRLWSRKLKVDLSNLPIPDFPLARDFSSQHI